MATKRNVESPRQLFARELEGEEPLSAETGVRLCRLAREFHQREPWRRLDDDQLVFVRAERWPEAHACCVLGALGEVFALQVYRGAKGYRGYLRLLELAEDMGSAGEFYAGASMVSVEFVPRREITRQDRELLAAADYARQGAAPQFRAVRPGYYPWYLCEDEGRILAGCLGGMNWFCDQATGMHYRDESDVYPLVTVSAGGAGYSLGTIAAPRPPEDVPEPAALDAERLTRISQRELRPEGVIEVEHFYAPGMIGEAHQRKACVRIALAVDSRSGIVYAPEVGAARETTGKMVADVVLHAIETAGVLPREVRVRDALHRKLLDPLGRALGFRISVQRRLPALDLAKESLLKMWSGR